MDRSGATHAASSDPRLERAVKMDKSKYIEFEVSLAKIFVCNRTFLVFYVALLAHQRPFEEHRPSQPSCERPLALLHPRVLLPLDAAAEGGGTKVTAGRGCSTGF